MGKKMFSKNSQALIEEMKKKKIPVLTLDEKWLSLFPVNKQNGKQKALVKEINEGFAKQAALNKQIAELKNRKSKIMKLVVEKMDSNDSDKIMGKLKMELDDTNARIERMLEALDEIPAIIELANEKLAIESMNICYGLIEKNTKALDSTNRWIEETRAKLKEKILEKQDMEEENQKAYSYMHDLLGAQIIDEFDKAAVNIKGKE